MSRPGLADPRLTKAQGGSTQAGFPGGVATPPGKLRVSDILCMSNLVHASELKEHEDNDDYQ